MDFLSRIFETIRKLIPRVYLIAPDERGIRVTLGTRVKVLEPGWYIYWGVIQDLQAITVTTQVIDLRPQSVYDKNNRNWTVSGIIKYRVSDVRKALLSVQDYDQSLQALSLGALLTILSNVENIEVASSEGIAEQVLAKVREEAFGWGLKIQRVFISDLGQVRNIRLLTDRVVE